MLACFGIYGMISYSVAARTAEIGIRMALGARAGDVSRSIIGDALRVVIPGITIGALVALGVQRYVESLLFGGDWARSGYLCVSGFGPHRRRCSGSLFAWTPRVAYQSRHRASKRVSPRHECRSPNADIPFGVPHSRGILF